MYVLVAILVLVVVIFGVSSTAQSYATAQQAQAQIETARAAQLASTGNLVTILTTALVIVAVLVLIAFGLWILYKRSMKSQQRSAFSGQHSVHGQLDDASPMPALKTLIQLETLKALRAMNAPFTPALPDGRSVQQDHEQPVEELFPWLR